MTEKRNSSHHPPFYGVEILREREQKKIKEFLNKWKGKPADEALKKEIYDALLKEREEGRISIPFKVALRKDPSKIHPDYVEVILDSKV